MIDGYNAAGAFGTPAAAADAAKAARINAVRSFGVIVTLEPDEFLRLVERQDEPLIVECKSAGFFATEYRYLVSYKGLTFFTKASKRLRLPAGIELVVSQKLYLPG